MWPSRPSRSCVCSTRMHDGPRFATQKNHPAVDRWVCARPFRGTQQRHTHTWGGTRPCLPIKATPFPLSLSLAKAEKSSPLETGGCCVSKKRLRRKEISSSNQPLNKGALVAETLLPSNGGRLLSMQEVHFLNCKLRIFWPCFSVSPRRPRSSRHSSLSLFISLLASVCSFPP